MFSCVQDEILTGTNVTTENKENSVQIFMNLPELQSVNAEKVSTKAMNDEAERLIDQSKLSVLVFKSNSGTETYAYKAPISGSIKYDVQNGTKAMITVKLSESKPGEYCRLLFIANQEITNIALEPGVTHKEDLLQDLTYTVPGKWNADTYNYTAFPMWGESEIITISEPMSSQSINLYRALARIDIGLNFKTNNGALSEDAHGLSNFKLNEIKVYRTYNKGYAAPLNSSMLSYSQPFIPSDAVRNADNTPISYHTEDNQGTDKYIREIYIPEANTPSSPGNNNMHCLVVGGYYSGSSSVSYYRLDFATGNQGTDDHAYLPVLRNHRYVFNITTVRGPGFSTPEAALQSTSTAGSINYDVISWEESILKMTVHGKYYLGLDQEILTFKPQPTSVSPTNSFKVRYQTNYPLSASDPLSLTWKNGDSALPFRAEWDEFNESINLVALAENTTNTVLSDTLFVKAGPIVIPIRIEQLYLNFNYTINCESVSVNGIYKSGTTLNATHYIDFFLTAEDRTIQGETYAFETVDMEGEHGIRFSASGVFDFSNINEGQPLSFKVRMHGSGTLSHNNSNGSFKLRIKSNSSSGSYCEATIAPVGRKLKILVLGNQELFGYNIAIPNTGAHKVLTSTNNFGPFDHSIVKTEGFELINAGMNGSTSTVEPNLSKIKKWLIDGPEIVDILYITQDVYVFSTESGELSKLVGYIAQYLNNNGVVLVFNEGNGANYPYTAANLINACLGVTNITQIQQGTPGLLYQLSGNPEISNDPFFSDPVLNGPFGDIRKKQWGEDASYAALLSNLPVDEIVVYSNGVSLNGPTSPENRINMVSGFRHKTKNLLYFGDGGFTSSGTNGQPYIVNYGTICPFNWDTDTMFPIPYPTYGSYYAQMEAYNSQVWCNAMAWAVNRAVNHGINTK